MTGLYSTSLILLALVLICESQMCPQDPDCSMATSLDKVVDPMDCRNYYICIEETIATVVTGGGSNTLVPAGPLTCPDGEVFDSASAICIESATCNDVCPITPADCASKETVPCSTASFTYFPDYTDCNKYYICDAQEHAVSTSCTDAPNLYFDGLGCGSDESDCCTTLVCDPYCEAGHIFTADPCDCHSYYYCDGQAGSDATNPTTCKDSGSYIDVNTYAPCDYTVTNCNSTCTQVECGLATLSPECVDEPYCIAAFDAIPDPCDCHSYYFCNSANYFPDDSTRSTCPNGKIFQESSQSCVSGTCSSMCSSSAQIC